MIKIFFKWFFRGFGIVSVCAVIVVAAAWLFAKLISLFGVVVSAPIVLAILCFLSLVLYAVVMAKQEYAMKAIEKNEQRMNLGNGNLLKGIKKIVTKSIHIL